MFSIRLIWMTMSAFAILHLFLACEASRSFNRRSDMANIPPVSALDWTVPLQGGMTCQSDDHCIDTLSPPTKDRSLQLLTIGHGFFKYSCATSEANDPPTFVSQSTELYDASPVIINLPDEESFHALIPKFCEFDYGQVDNSTLECIGSIGTVKGTAVISLFGLVDFDVFPEEVINPPNNPHFNGLWAHSTTPQKDWDIYRVEMAGGAIPENCEGKEKLFEIEYAAEYWFYHTNP